MQYTNRARLWLLAALIITSTGCNLSRTEVASLPTGTPAVTADTASRPTRTPIAFGITELPTLLPLPDGSGALNTPRPTLIPVTSVPPIGSMCQVYTTYSGADPRNSLSLRTSASTASPQVFRVPTNQHVLLVPGSQEVEAEGYHWLNVIYEAREMRYIGWMARDSFSTNGVRDPSVATLRPLGAQAGC